MALARTTAKPVDVDRLALAARLWDWRPHPGQREFLSLRLPDGSEPKTLVAACGRRWGKTEGLSVDIATRLLTETDLAQLLVGPTRDQADGLFDAVEEKLREVIDDEKLAAEFPHVLDFEVKRSPYCHIRRKSDGQMILSARSAGRNGRNLRGKGTTRKMKRFRVVIDEAAFVNDQAINEAIRPMLATVPGGGQLVMISSPNGKRGPFYDAFVKAERGDKKARGVRLPSSQNPLVDAEFLAEMREEMTDRQYRAEFLAEFVDAAGQVFPDADIEAAVIDDDYGNEPLWGMNYVAGIDFGRRGDYTVVSILEVSAVGLRLVRLFRCQGLSWGSQIEEVANLIQHWGVRRAATDRTGMGDPLTESLTAALIERRHGCEIDEFVFTAGSKPVLIDKLVIALAKQVLKFPAHPILLSELRNFEATERANGREKLEAARGHDDTVCSLALAVYAAGPLIARAGGSTLMAVGPRRTIGRDLDEKKDLDFSCGNSLQTFWASVAQQVLINLLSLLLVNVYRSALCRRVGASAARRMSTKKRNIRPGA